MDSLLSIFSGLLVHLNPVEVWLGLNPHQVIAIAQVGFILLLAGLAAIGMIRLGLPERQALGVAFIVAGLVGFYRLSSHGSEILIAERSVAMAGGLFRFIGGFGVALGLAGLFGLGRAECFESRVDLSSPVVWIATGVYGAACALGLRPYGMAVGMQIWLVLSLIAAWLAFAGIHGILRRSLHCNEHERPLQLVAVGALTLVLLSLLGTPVLVGHGSFYTGWFPAGIVVGLLRSVVAAEPNGYEADQSNAQHGALHRTPWI